MTDAILQLKKGKEKSLLRRHPWIFSGAVQKISPGTKPGDTVLVQSADGRALAKAAYSPTSQIIARVWTFDMTQPVDRTFFSSRIRRALAWRESLIDRAKYTAYRLINAESDGLPGFVVDRYGDFVVCQLTACGIEAWKATIIDLLQEMIPCRGIFERSDLAVREKEGLSLRVGLLAGQDLPELVEIEESQKRFWVDCRKGHKTGFYLDQRDNRSVVERLSRDRRVLNCFSYTGGFTIAALFGGAAQVTNIDISAPALTLLERHVQHNGFDLTQTSQIQGNAFEVLRVLVAKREKFDMVILDPPKFAESKQSLSAACRGYKDINMLAMKLLDPGGLLLTFSCSGLLPPDLFQKIVADAALDAHQEAAIVQRLNQAPDHAMSLTFPESWYLKGFVCKMA